MYNSTNQQDPGSTSGNRRQPTGFFDPQKGIALANKTTPGPSDCFQG